MIDGVGKASAGRLELVRSSSERAEAPARTGSTGQRVEGTVSSPVSDMAAMGAPIDAGKIAEIRAAIAEGRYPVDPAAIAAKMIELDLGSKGGS